MRSKLLRSIGAALALALAASGPVAAQPAPDAPPSAPRPVAPWDIDELVRLYREDPANLPPLPDDVLRLVHERAHAPQSP